MTKTKQRKTPAARVAALEQKLALLSTGRKKQQKKKTPFADVGSIIGNAAGSMFGNGSRGAGIGKWLGSGIGSIFGSGDYQMTGPMPSYNVLTSSAQVPKFSTTKATNVVCHREYLGDILGTAAFNNTAYPLNPGMGQTFPWLATIAQNYQEYKFHGVMFEFRPLITDFVTSGAPGVVVMATNYNAGSAVYDTKQDMENSEFAVAVKPTNGLIHGIECATNQTTFNQRYVRTGTVPAGQDLRLYDYGTFQFATQNNPIQNLGELWVSYCVEFLKPVLPQDVGGIILSGHASRTTVVPANPFGSIQILSVGSLAIAVNSTTISWTGQPSQTYQVTCTWVGTNTAGVQAPAFTFTGCVAKNLFNNDASSVITAPSPAASSAGVVATFIVGCTLTSPGTITVTAGGAGVFPTSANCDVMVSEFGVSVTN